MKLNEQNINKIASQLVKIVLVITIPLAFCATILSIFFLVIGSTKISWEYLLSLLIIWGILIFLYINRDIQPNVV